MAKKISELTISDFPYIYKLNNSLRLVSNVSGLGARYYHSMRTGGEIDLYSGIPKNYNEFFVSYSYDFDADNNDSPLKFPTEFRDYTGKIPRNTIDTNVLFVGSAWFSSPGQKEVWLYFVVDDTPDLEHINPSLKADNVTVSITGNTVNLKANSGYTIKDATLDIGNSLFGDDTPLKFTVSPDKTTATVTVTDQSLIDASQEYNLTVHTKVQTDLEHINPSLKADNVTVTITGNTVNLKANSGYTIKDATLDIGNSLFGDDTPLDFTVSQDKTTATVTVTDDSLIDASQEYNLTVHTEEVPTETPTQPSEPTPPVETPDTNKFTGTITSKIQGVTANLNNITGVITITIPDNSNFTGTVNVVDSTNQTIETLAINNNTVTIPDRYANDNFVVDGILKYQTNYQVDITQIKDYVDYKTDGLIITLTGKQDVTINSLRAVADLTLFGGETYQLDSSTIKIADNKKSATITVPNDYNTKLGYTIVISGDFTKNTPIPTNPKATGTLHIYQLDDKTLETFSTKAVETFNSGHNETYNFQKFITQLYKLPFFIPETESKGTTNILTGWYTVNEPARLLNKNHYIKDLGNIKVLPVNNNGYDHNVTNCTLYLPFVSPISVSYETVLNHTVNIKYDTDLAGAKTTVNIFVDNELYKTIQVSIIENLDLYNIYNDSINGTLSSILNNTLDHCFIKVEYNKPIENLVSYETREHNTLSNYTNFVKTKNAIVSCGTQQEQMEIENLLNGGIYIK